MVGLLVLYGLVAFAPVAAAMPTVALSTLDGATTGSSFALVVDVAGADSAKLVLDGTYVGRDDTPPLSFDLTLSPGVHRAKVRTLDGTVESRFDVTFIVTASSAPTTLAPAPPTSSSTTSASTTVAPPTSTTTPAAGPAEVVADTVAEIRTALATAAPGTVVRIADGEYRFSSRLVASASGTAAAPITVRGSEKAVLRSTGTSGDYGLHVTGDHWRIEGLTVAQASKGIVLDGSVGTVIDGVEVRDIGEEGVHFRTCSSDGVLRNSRIRNTGRVSPQYGEGVYVGSAGSNWASFQCADAVERRSTGDNTERVLIEGNTFEDVPAEGADLKEGTDSGVLRGNVFRRVGASGLNSADSAVDVKGSNWVVEDNVVTETSAPWYSGGVAKPSRFVDGFQTHTVATGYGTGNVMRRNRVEGSIPGFGFALDPGTGNLVSCDNVAAGAAKGLVGDRGKAAACRP